jgi:hypothetical protein
MKNSGELWQIVLDFKGDFAILRHEASAKEI